MSDDDKSEISSVRSDDEESDNEDRAENFKNKKLVLPPGVKAPYVEDEDGEMSEDDDDSDESEDEDDDMSDDDGDDGDEPLTEDIFTKVPEKQKKEKKNKKTREEELEIAYEMDEDDNDDAEDDEDGEQYLQKFDEFTKKTTIDQYHPELSQHNHDEIEALSEIVRDGDGNIIDPLHVTLPFLTKYERARILGERAKQLDAGATPLITINDQELIDSYLIAVLELEQKKIPFIVKRPLPNGGCEYWKLKDLEVL
jgi:DNA-directed RNA polymerase I, II, and III subunit RPABC2